MKIKKQKNTSPLIVALAQIDKVWEDKAANSKTCAAIVTRAKGQGADLIIFPEMTLTGYSMNIQKTAEPEAKSLTIEFFSALAKQHKIHIIFGMVLAAGKKGKNSCVHIDTTGKVKAVYAKIHPFSLVHEERHIEAGDRLVITSVNGWRVALTVCYDLRFPGLFEAIAKHRPDAIVVIANWPEPRIRDWQTLLRARALDTRSFVLGVNRVCEGNGLRYNGYSSVYSPWGEELLCLPGKRARLGFVTLDQAMITDVRKNFSTLDDKRMALYPNL